MPRGGKRDGAGRPKKTEEEIFNKNIEDMAIAGEVFRRLGAIASERQAHEIDRSLHQSIGDAWPAIGQTHDDLREERDSGGLETSYYREMKEEAEEAREVLVAALDENGRPQLPNLRQPKRALAAVFQEVADHLSELWEKRVGVGTVKECWHRNSKYFTNSTPPDV